ncbi:Type 2A phosphatase-associated protein 42 [Pleosporales sp. CAS-2024a]
MSDQPQSIRALFSNAEQARQELAASYDSNSATFQEKLSKTIATYEQCLELSEQVSLFSRNESLEDIASGDLQYLAIHHHLGELIQKTSTCDLSTRRNNIMRAREHYEAFLKLLDSYDMLGASDCRLLEAYSEDKASFSTSNTRDAAARRDGKIARFRQEEEIKRKLEYLEQKATMGEDDEHVVRDVHVTNLGLMVFQTFQALESMAMELHMISLAPPAAPPGAGVTGATADARQDSRKTELYSERLDGQLPGLGNSGPLLSRDGKPMRPFTLLDSRQSRTKDVFRQTNLPTMTIDEYLDEEKRRGGMIEGGGPQSEMQPEVDEDNVEAADAETMKQRAWDEYVEANPKGSGNTLNRG